LSSVPILSEGQGIRKAGCYRRQGIRMSSGL